MLVIIYLLEDEQELSLGMLIRPKRIYNFCLLHASFGRYCYDIYTLPYTFDHIWTNLLTQCTPVPVSVFCCFCISGFPITKTARKIPEKLYKKSAFQKLPGTRSRAGGGHQGSRRPGGAAPLLAAPGGAWAPQVSADAPLWPIFNTRPETLETGTLFRDLISVPPPPRFQDRERQENSSRHPAGGEDHHRDLLLLGNIVISKKFLRTRKIMVMYSNERESIVYIPL